MDLGLKRVGADADLDDSGWPQIQVPGHWGQADDFDDHNGPLLYRRRFSHRQPVDDERLWLRFDGVLSGGEIWLDGSYIGDTSTYFAAHRFDVTDLLSKDEDHLLAVEVSCPDQSGDQPKTSLTGSLQAGHLAPAGNPGGIWQPVAIDSTGPVAIRYARLLCTSAEPDRAELTIRLVLNAEDQTEIQVDTSVSGPDGPAGGGAERHTLASGENRIEWTVPIDGPRLWWPAALGEQPMYDVSVAVRDEDGQVSDRREWRTGLRKVTTEDFIWRVNGRRLFAKGIVAGPSHRFLNQVTAAELNQDMQAVRDAGIDLVRLYGHIGREETYREADRLGLLIWQDLPLVGRYSSKARSATRTLARAAVDHLGHHPSVGLWCAHCEPNGHRQTTAASQTATGGTATRSGSGLVERWPTLNAARQVGTHLLPSWNRSVFDPIVARELRNGDKTRRVIHRSGSPPGPAAPTGSDAHLWLGWHTGEADNLSLLMRRWPRLGVFLGGIGSQSAVVEDWDRQAPNWPGAQADAFARYLPRTAYASGEAWAMATQSYQSDVIRTHIEAIRRLKYRPAGGFLISALADVSPGGGFGVLQADRSQKPAYNVLVDACRPVIVVGEPPPPVVVAGQELVIGVHAISDLQTALPSVRVTGRAHGHSWSQEVAWEGDVPADTCQWIGEFRFTVPDTPRQLHIDLELVSGELVATNRYSTVVIPESESLG
jgi:beta-mannosidase